MMILISSCSLIAGIDLRCVEALVSGTYEHMPHIAFALYSPVQPPHKLACVRRLPLTHPHVRHPCLNSFNDRQLERRVEETTAKVVPPCLSTCHETTAKPTVPSVQLMRQKQTPFSERSPIIKSEAQTPGAIYVLFVHYLQNNILALAHTTDITNAHLTHYQHQCQHLPI